MIYLDNAATSLRRPEGVVRAVRVGVASVNTNVDVDFLF